MDVKDSDGKTVQNYKFLDFSVKSSGCDAEVSNYEMQTLDALAVSSEDKRDRLIRAERASAKENSFKISSVVRLHRGMEAQEAREYDERIRENVDLQVNKVKDEAFRKGYDEGIERGRREVYENMKETSEEKLEKLTEIVSLLMKEKEDVLRREKNEVYNLVKSLTKWIILRELKDDDDYVKRLIEKMISEIGANQRVLIQVGAQQFESIPEILDFIKNMIGDIDNVRVEIDYDISDRGIVIETENGIIKGTLEEQFTALDRLFETAGLGDNHGRKAA